jgi:hypothetical protein
LWQQKNLGGDTRKFAFSLEEKCTRKKIETPDGIIVKDFPRPRIENAFRSGKFGTRRDQRMLSSIVTCAGFLKSIGFHNNFNHYDTYWKPILYAGMLTAQVPEEQHNETSKSGYLQIPLIGAEKPSEEIPPPSNGSLVPVGKNKV